MLFEAPMSRPRLHQPGSTGGSAITKHLLLARRALSNGARGEFLDQPDWFALQSCLASGLNDHGRVCDVMRGAKLDLPANQENCTPEIRATEIARAWRNQTG